MRPVRSGGPSAFLGTGHDPSEPHRPYSPHLASGAGRQAALSHYLGRGDGARARPHHRHGVAAADRNVIGTHGGSYAVYRALAVSSGALDPIRRADLTNTQPAVAIGPFPQWAGAPTIVSLDPWGHMVAEAFARRSPRASTSAPASP